MIKEKIRILIVEDNDDDLALLLRELNKSRYDLYYERVQKEDEFRKSLENEWDFIISDFSLPEFDGLEALKILNEAGRDIPFIMVSGTVGEDIAVSMMKSGARDYIMKDSLIRLLPAIDRELEETSVRKKNELSAKEKDVIFQINQDILNSENLEELLQRIHDNIKKVIYAEHCFVVLCNSETKILTFPLFRIKDQKNPMSRKMAKGVSEIILDIGKVMILDNKEIRKALTDYKINYEYEIANSIMFAPLRIKTKQIGAIALISYDKDKAFREPEKNFIEGIAGQIAIAIEKRSAEDNLRESEKNAYAIINATTDAAFLMEINGTAITMNDEMARRYGRGKTKEQMVGIDMHSVITPHLAEERLIREKEVIRTKKPLRFEDREGGVILDNRMFPVFDKNGNVIRFAVFSRDVTQSRLAEKALEESEEKYRTIFENVQDIFFRLDKDYNIVEISPSVEKYTKYKRDELLGKHVSFVYEDSDDLNRLAEINQKVGSVNDYVLKLKDKNGEIRYVSNSSHVIYDENGNFIGTEGILRDISERKRMEEDIKESENRYRSIFENIQDVYYRIDEHALISEISPSIEKLAGYTREELLNKPAINLYKNPSDFNKFIDDIRKTGKLQDYELQMRHKSGKCVFISLSSQIRFDSENNIAGTEGMLRDITERKKYEESLKENEERYKLLVQTMHDGIAQTDDNDIILYVNESACKMFGYTEEELLGSKLMDTLVLKSDRAVLSEKAKMRLENISDKYELRGVKKSGEIIWLSVSGTPFMKDGKIFGSVGFLNDITEQKKATEELVKISQAVKQSPVIVMITDRNGKIEYVNPKFTEATGYTFEEIVGKYPRILKSGETNSEVYTMLWDVILSGKDWAGEFHNKKKNGELYWDYTTISPVRNTIGEITHFLAIKEDITEKKAKEQELIAAKEKAETSERLKTSFLANMSHELRTPMIGILGFADLIKELADNPEMVEFSDAILKSGKRLMETLNLILDISRIEADKLEVNTNDVNVVPLVKEAFQNYTAAAAAKNVRTTFFSSADEIVSRVDEKLLYESVNNLINNAVKYTKSGEIKVEVLAEKRYNGKKTVIKVSDTGIGIPGEYIDQIFEEFRQVSEGFSRGFEGTGLGLTITRNFIEKMGGKISVESEVGVGTVFSVELPLVEVTLGDSEKNVPGESAKPLPENTEVNILCVEDDYFTVNYIGHVLKDYFKVSFASNGLEAIDKAKSVMFDLILMDINLGRGINGIETTRKIKKLPGYAEIPVVAMTAFAMKGDKEEFLASGMSNYISKPFKSSELIIVINEELKKR
ncbi:MAG: PAS domain S-box protein [Bacteroidetes bacterium]|nr:PAS domain S-box protein [Bacteroidota bacterium]